MVYPIEDPAELTRLRSLMSPFMINIQKCFTTKNLNYQQQARIHYEILDSISPVVDPELLNGLNQIIGQPENRTLDLEQRALRQISIRYS